MKRIVLALLIVCLIPIGNAVTAIGSCAYTINTPGEYALSTSLSCSAHGITLNSSNVELSLAGYTIDGDDGASDRGIYVLAGNGSILNNITIADGAITDFGIGIDIFNTTNINVRNVSVSSCAGRGIRATANLDTGQLINATLANVTVANSGSDGIYTGLSTGGSGTPTIGGVVIANSTIYNSANFGQIYATGPVTIHNNTLHDSGGSTHGIDYASTAGANISLNTIYNTTGSGITNYNGANAHIYNNTIYAVTTGVKLTQANADNNTVEDNLIYDGNGATTYGVYLDAGPTYNLVRNNTISNVTYGLRSDATTATTDDSNFTGNHITNVTRCIYITASDDFEIRNNFCGNALTGFMFETTSKLHTVAGNTIENVTNGMYLGSTDSQEYYNNSIFNATKYLWVTDTADTDWYNTTFGYSPAYGWANLSYFNLTDAVTIEEGTNVRFQPAFVSINTTIAGTSMPSSPAAVQLQTDGGCINDTAMKKTGFPATAADIITNGTLIHAGVTCAGGVASFPVTSFSGYALGGPPDTIINLNFPNNGAVLSGDSTLLMYNITTLDNVTCNTTLDTDVIDSRNFTANGSANITASPAIGSHLWEVTCYLTSDPAYYRASPTYYFSMSFSTYERVLNLSTTVEPVLDSPQSLFYDAGGNLNVLYFLNDTPTLHISRVDNLSLTLNHTAALNATKPFFATFRNATDTLLLAYSGDNATRHFIVLNNTGMAILNASAGYNVTQNNMYDPAAYANTKNLPDLTPTADSYYLFILPTAADSRLIRMNYSITTFQELNTTFHSRKVAWGTIAANANLTSWYYPWLSNASCNSTSDRIQIWRYNGTASAINATPDTTCRNQAEVEGSRIVFEQYGNHTYALISNITNRTVIHQIEGNKTYSFNTTASEVSQILFMDEDTLIFFSREGGDTYAYSCYFANNATCTRYPSSDYGATVPFYTGNMSTAKRNGTSDVTAVGKVTNWDVLKFLYSEKIYDTKFICYDEMDEYRKNFTVQVFTQNTSQILKTPPSYGYALPSDMIGAGRKRAYFLCAVGTQRLFLVGLNNDFTINSYSLDNTTGTYYTFRILNAYGQAVQNITVTAQRFSNMEQSYVTIEQGVSDYTGSVTLFLELFALYQITMDADGYVPITFEFVPSGTTSVEVTLDTANASLVQLPTYSRVFNDVSYSITPNTGSFFEPDENLTYHVVSSNSTLEYYGVTITRRYNGTLTTVYDSNVTTSPAGGLMEYETNGTGVYTVTTWFKAQDYDTFYPTPRTFYIGNTTGLAHVREILTTDEPISGWFYYLIAVGSAMLVAGFVSKYTVEGAGLVGLIVLWGFTLMYPGAMIVPELNISTFMATTLTTVMVGAGFYVMKSGV